MVAFAIVLAERLEVSELAVHMARAELQRFREKKAGRKFSGIVLAEGKSSRMGQNKAELRLQGKSLLEWQVEKLRAIGIHDILLSGANCQNLPGTRVVPDLYPDRGPLGGLHACLRAAENPQCVVVTVDTPLLPASILSKMCRAHECGVTALQHGEKLEPLIAVYDCSISEEIEPLIAQHSAPVRALRDRVDWSTFCYRGSEDLLLNCNTPEEFRAAEDYLAAEAGFVG